MKLLMPSIATIRRMGQLLSLVQSSPMPTEEAGSLTPAAKTEKGTAMANRVTVTYGCDTLPQLGDVPNGYVICLGDVGEKFYMVTNDFTGSERRIVKLDDGTCYTKALSHRVRPIKGGSTVSITV